MRLRALVFWQEGHWAAQVLEHDIASQGKTLEDVVSRLAGQIAVELVVRQNSEYAPFAEIPRAPDWYWEQYVEAMSLTPRPISVEPEKHMELPDVDFKVAA